MAFGTIEIVSMTRTQDYTTIKQNQDNKPMVDQTNFGQQMDKQTEQLTKQVTSSDNADWYNQKQDAKEKGKNEYRGDGGKNRKKQDMSGKVIPKGIGGFDMKV